MRGNETHHDRQVRTGRVWSPCSGDAEGRRCQSRRAAIPCHHPRQSKKQISRLPDARGPYAYARGFKMRSGFPGLVTVLGAQQDCVT